MSRTIVHKFDVTIPAGTPKATPVVTLTQFPDNEVERIEWLFPDGCNGQVGIQIGARSTPIVPAGVGQFIVRSGDSHGYDLTEQHLTGDWSVIGYNLGAFSHTVHVYFYLHRIPVEQPLPYYLTDQTIAMLKGGE